MSVYNLMAAVTTVQTVAAVGSNSNPIVTAPQSESGSGSPPAVQAFVALVTGANAVSAGVQFVASNDGINFFNLGTTTVSPSGTNAAASSLAGTAPFNYYGAFCTTIAGTNAQAFANVSM